jgi:hypothetical protein
MRLVDPKPKSKLPLTMAQEGTKDWWKISGRLVPATNYKGGLGKVTRTEAGQMPRTNRPLKPGNTIAG